MLDFRRREGVVERHPNPDSFNSMLDFRLHNHRVHGWMGLRPFNSMLDFPDNVRYDCQMIDPIFQFYVRFSSKLMPSW